MRASAHYRRLWRAFLVVGLLSLALITPLIITILAELAAIGHAPFGSKIREYSPATLSSSPLALTDILIGLLLLFIVGRWSPRGVMAGTALLALGAILDVKDDWILLEDVLNPAERDSVTAFTVITTFIWVVPTIDALAALLVLRSLRPAASGPTVLTRLTVFSKLATSRTRHERTFRASRLAWLGVALGLASALTALLHYFKAAWFQQEVLGAPRFQASATFQAAFNAWSTAHPYRAAIGAMSDVVSWVLTIAIFTFAFRFFWRLVVADANKLLSNPDYRPIVFLRSFADDAATVTSKRLTDRLIGRRRRLEEIAVGALAPLGAAIAIGQPGERLPKLGAIRAYYADDQWQAAVLEWMRRAHLIAIVGGASRWTLWEFKQVLDSAYTDKLLLLLPPDRDEAARLARWQALVDTAAGTRWERSMRSLQPPGVIAAMLRPDGEVLAVCGNDRLQADYEAGVQLAIVELLRPAPRCAETR